jgi:enoyl-CoA hydratase/carnithine racemase
MSSGPALYRTHLSQYAPQFEEIAKLRRENGILEVRLHTDDGPFGWGVEVHRLLIPLLQLIDHDEDNEVVILTGTGETFNASTDVDNYIRHGGLGRWDSEKLGYDMTYRDQTREVHALLALNVPVVCAINGPIRAHAELALVNDIVLCSDNTWIMDAHWSGLGIVPGDGVHTLFRELLGHNRARYLMYTGTKIGAAEALRLGLVGEVVGPARLLDRSWEIAEQVFMTKSRIQRRLARALLIQPWRELFMREIASGMAHECLATAIAGPTGIPGGTASRVISPSGVDKA